MNNQSDRDRQGACGTGAEAAYQHKLDQGQFMIQRCGDCERHVFFPRMLCPHCGGTALRWVAPAGTGTVHAVTTVRRKPDAGGDYNVSLIDLDEGVRMMSRVEGTAPMRIGDRVRARVQLAQGRGLVVFDPMPGKGEQA